jgi:polysaccharide chain length determinant protein (PEP-CTERM system associated)
MHDDPAEGTRYTEESDGDSLSFRDVHRFVRAPLRRPLAVLVPWAAVLGLSVLALFVLPKRYRSSTLILVESEKVPDSFVPRVATDKSNRRIDNVRSEVLSRTRLEKVLDETDPYPEITSKTVAVETMRGRASVNGAGSDGIVIEFVHRDAEKAQQVANRLATLFIEETVKSRQQQVAGAVDFLVTQVGGARKQLEEKDLALRLFKEQRMGTLPEQLQTNLATVQGLQREIQSVEESLYLARAKQEALARAAAGGTDVDPTSPAEGELGVLMRQLASLRNRYTEEHPDVQSLKARILRIQERAAQGVPENDPAPVDPALRITRAQLQSADLEVRKLEDRHADLERRIRSISARIDNTPRTEQELATLTRDYNKLQENYTSLLSKQLEAEMAGRLEQRWKGEQFRMLDPAHLPEKPDFPRPTLFIGMGLLVGLLTGLATAVAAEYFDPTVKSVEDLQELREFPVLARIPHLPVAEESQP